MTNNIFSEHFLILDYIRKTRKKQWKCFLKQFHGMQIGMVPTALIYATYNINLKWKKERIHEMQQPQ